MQIFESERRIHQGTKLSAIGVVLKSNDVQLPIRVTNERFSPQYYHFGVGLIQLTSAD